VHSVLGGFGFNSSMYDAANLGWKLGLCIKKQAEPTILLPTYDSERRIFANRVIRCSGAYLRFICNSHLPLAALRGLDENLETHDEVLPKLDNTPESDFQFVYTFYRRHAMFLLGIEWPIIESPICPPDTRDEQRPVSLRNGVRPPNPRVCLETEYTAYLYDKMGGVSRFHIIIFGSDMQGPVRTQLAIFSQKAFRKNGFFHQYGGKDRFNIILVVKALPHEAATLLGPRDGEEDDLKSLREQATVVFDDRVPDDDAHYWYGVNHARGAVVAVRPDLAVGFSIWPENVEELDAYFGSFLVRQSAARPENAKGAVEVVSNEVSGSEGSDKGVAAHRRRSIRSWISDILA
jgi:phenol 2-monooxygenase